MPAVKVGQNKPPRNQRKAAPSAEQRRWEVGQKSRLAGQQQGAAAPSVKVAVPEGQGDVPWHQIFDFRITDSLVGRIDYSTGNMMLAATDFDIAGVGNSLQLTRTYNSFFAPSGQISTPWWSGYERNLEAFANDDVIWYDSSGASIDFLKNADGTFKTPDGYGKDLKKNSDGTYTLTDRKSGSKDTYNANGVLTKVTDRNNGTITVTAHADADGWRAGFKLTEDRSGRTIDLVKTSDALWTATDNSGRSVKYDIDAAHHLVRSWDTTGRATSYGYDEDGRLTKVTTPESRTTEFTYDSQSRVTSMRRSTELGGTSDQAPTYTYSYNAEYPWQAGITTVTDPLMNATKYEHNADGEVTKVTDAWSHERSTSYKAHLTQTATDAMGVGGGIGNVTAYGWDTRGNPTSAKLPTGATSTVAGWSTKAGRDVPASATSADGDKTDYGYDAAGNTISVAQSGTGGGSATIDYNPATATCGGFQGQRCKATTKLSGTQNSVTSFHYDTRGNLDSVTPPTQIGKVTYHYDALGRVTDSKDGRGVTTLYTYDDRDRVKKVDTGSYDTVTYVYDGDGNLTSRTDRTGTQSYQFDALSRETIRTLQDGSQTVLAYTANGNVDTYTDPSGVLDYTWDKANRLTELKDQAGRKTVYAYNANDTRTGTTYPGNTVQSVDVDKSNRPTTIKTTSPKGTLTHLTYTYGYGTGGATDGTKIRSATDVLAGLKTSYTYDVAGRFSYAKEEKGSTFNSSWQYCYDLAGNLTSQGVDPGCPRGTTYTVNDAEQITGKNGSTTNWSYDRAGNETAGASTPEGTRTAEKWSDYSQLKSLTVGSTVYAGQYASTDQSERTKLGQTSFHNGPLGLSAETTGGVDTGFNREPGGTLNSMTTGGKAYYYLTDALGSVIGLADETGTKVNTYSYSPRGVARTAIEAAPQPYRFAGGHQDPTGLYHLGARYYDPNIGRFTQPDPSGQEKNPYLYAEGDPVNRIDPNGLLSVGGVLKGSLKWAGRATSGKALWDAGNALLDGDYRTVGAVAAGEVVSGLIDAACVPSAAGAGAPTAGAGGFVVGAACFTVAEYAGNQVQNGLS
ncbi:RHS repeat-associated core domain-containing protein [Streptomyces xanthochromogenes]|uniref:RHS repeat-associated core domain-containing protein n=1 Tax=Streptomyces xanthochromogenes TaxID=67384 RepID=UPI001E4251C1|nr:RHS repeat-associated core domain-containing protein [Streptomyces xanthochromogenes]